MWAQSLIIEQGDDEKTIQRKKKAMKKLKSERRFQEMDQAQKSRQQSWQSFQKGKGVSKKKVWRRKGGGVGERGGEGGACAPLRAAN